MLAVNTTPARYVPFSSFSFVFLGVKSIIIISRTNAQIPPVNCMTTSGSHPFGPSMKLIAVTIIPATTNVISGACLLISLIVREKGLEPLRLYDTQPSTVRVYLIPPLSHTSRYCYRPRDHGTL